MHGKAQQPKKWDHLLQYIRAQTAGSCTRSVAERIICARRKLEEGGFLGLPWST